VRYWEIKEAEAQKVVAVMPGGFHPFHPGHKSLYDWASKTFGKENVFVAATNDTSSRPFPFDIKQKLAGMAGVPQDRFIQVKSPFNALSYEGIMGDPKKTSLVFVRSEKDQGTHPLPDQIRKSDGMPGYLISFKGTDQLQPAEAHAHIAYGPTINFDFAGMSIKSATELRNTWPGMSEEEKHKAAELMYGSGHNEAVKLLDQALGDTEAPVGEDVSPEDESKFHNELDDLVHKYFGDSPDEEKMKKKMKKVKDMQEAEVKPGQTLPKQIKVIKMPTPPQAPTGPDGTDENGTRIGTTPKGNRSVSSGAGTYIFTPKGELMLYMTPKIGGLQQTHNIKKQTVTINFGSGTVDQKATYDMSGKLLSRDTTSIRSAGAGVSIDKDKGTTLDYTVRPGLKISANSKTGIKVN
jgi:hypothetical protein